ncbi:Putative cryptic C4-dicarboxylate transporter DcuD [Yokenella regensburgei]|nr:Putative cryptic C4-dicarboxylate transporter DcuD [Yokenella regensburgei]
MSRGGDLGMMIMMLCGFAAYMTHIGANDMVVKLASKPLRYINSPYLLMIAAYFVACLMSLAVSSATGLGVLLMATLFPGDGKRRDQPWRSGGHLCFSCGSHSLTNVRRCGAGCQSC